MDLRITITDENNDVRWEGTIYQDGSDSEGTDTIADWIGQNFLLESNEDENFYKTKENHDG